MTAFQRGTSEYVEATITLSVDPTMPVEIAVGRSNREHVWLPATWVGTSTQFTQGGTIYYTRTARTNALVTFGDNYPDSAYTVWVRLTDTPEIPIISAGVVYVLGPSEASAPIPEDVIDGGGF